MADALFDTTVFIDYERGDHKAIALIEAVFQGSMIASFSIITVAELSQAERIDRDREIGYEALFAHFEEATVTRKAAWQAGEIRNRP